jgi:hypothetical protein
MSLSDEIRALADRNLGRLNEARNFYVHTLQAWRLAQEIASEGQPVGMVDMNSGLELPVQDLEARAQRYVTVYIPESVFKNLSGLLEDWVLGLVRLWLTAHPEDLDTEFNKSTGRTRKKKQEEIQIPLSRVLALPDRDAILRVEIERIVRDLTYERPDRWFRYLDRRLGLGCPDETQRGAFCEMKAARDVLEHNRGVINRDYLNKAGAAALYALGDIIQVEEPYLLRCFELLRVVIEAMADAAIRKSSGPGPA